MDIGGRIKRFRESMGWTKTRLAQMSGVSQSFISDIESGKKTPTVEVLGRICDALGITLADFFSSDRQADLTDTRLIKAINKLSPGEREALIRYIEETLKRQG